MDNALETVSKDSRKLKELSRFLRSQGFLSYADPETEHGRYLISLFRMFRDDLQGAWTDEQKDILAEIAASATVLFRSSMGQMIKVGGVIIPGKNSQNVDMVEARNRALALAAKINKQAYDMMMGFLKMVGNPGSSKDKENLFTRMENMMKKAIEDKTVDVGV